jgi:hypothetical protein
MHAIELSRIEAELLKAINSNALLRARQLATKHGMLRRGADGKLLPNRERSEIECKIRALGLNPPWNV